MTNRVRGNFQGIGTNAFALIGHFSKLAKRQNFSQVWISAVVSEAESRDYDFMLITLTNNMDDDSEPSNWVDVPDETCDENQLDMFLIASN